MKNPTLNQQLMELKLAFMRQHHQALIQKAADEQWSHTQLLSTLVEGELHHRRDNRIQRLIKAARFPVLKTLEDFDWTWPRKINRAQVQELFTLNCLSANESVVFMGGVGLGKSHLATALGYTACLHGHSVLFTTAVDIINTLSAAQQVGQLKKELRRYLTPRLIVIDELGYLPIDKTGADLLFQIFSQRYEKGALVLTTNLAFKKWPSIFNNDTTLTSAILDRLLHHSQVIKVEGRSYRVKDQLPSPE